jgi:hypothetical protein
MAARLKELFEERLQEIEDYLSFLNGLEASLGEGHGNRRSLGVTPRQQRILHSAVYLQLYSLVEATATSCLEAVAEAACGGRWSPSDLIPEMRREWYRSQAKTHDRDMTADNRLDAVAALCEVLIEAVPVRDWRFDRRSSGNWDDEALEGMAKRLGSELSVEKEAYQGVKRPIRDDMGPLVLVKDLRNRLAHGEISFTECGENATYTDLAKVKHLVARYLRAVVDHFTAYLEEQKFVRPEKRGDSL